MASGPSAVRRCHRNFPACAVHISLASQSGLSTGAPVPDGGAALGLSAARCVAHRVGAQHPAPGDAALLRNVSDAAQSGAETESRGPLAIESSRTFNLHWNIWMELQLLARPILSPRSTVAFAPTILRRPLWHHRTQWRILSDADRSRCSRLGRANS